MPTWQEIQAGADPSGGGAVATAPPPSAAAPVTPAASLQAAIQARMKMDTALQIALNEVENAKATSAELTALKNRVAKALVDYQQLQGSMPPEKTGGFLGQGMVDNPEYAAWKEKNDAVLEVLAPYYDLGGANSLNPKPNKDYAAIASSIAAADRLVAQKQNVAGARQQEITDAVTKESKVGTQIIQAPVEGRPGVTQPSVYDPNANGGAGGIVPAKDGAGNPLPVNITGGPELTRAGKPKEGSQSWTLKQSGDKWFNVPTVADASGEWVVDTAGGRMPQEVTALRGQPNVQILGGNPYLLQGDKLVAVPGYTKPPIVTDGGNGQKYYSTDDGKTWTPATGLPGKPQTLSSGGYVYPLDENGMPILAQAVQFHEQDKTEVVEGYLVRYNPATGKVERTDLYTPEQRARMDETAGITLDVARANLAKSAQLADPVAEYQRQVGLLQTTATKQRDALNDKVLRGELSVEDASTQFDSWWETNVEAKLQPYQTMAEGAYRKEQNEYQQKVAAEQARVDAINRQREQLGYQAGETARAGLNALAPQARSPEFLAQFAENVSKIGQPLPGGPSQHSGGMQFSPESLSLANVRRAMPNLTEVGQNAAARALASISPAAAQSVGAPPPAPPSLPDFQSYMAKAPFQIPDPTLPVPGRAAVDLGNPAGAAMLGLPVQPGYAGTQYQGGRVAEPWRIGG